MKTGTSSVIQAEWLQKEVTPVKDRLRSLHMLVDGSDIGSAIVDEYRRIKRPLLANAFGKTASLVDDGNIILVTSSVPGEGKTYTATNLALSIANEQDHNVLLIDCDVEKKGSSCVLGIDNQPGLMDVLGNEFLDLSDVMLKTDVPSFSVISAGKKHDYATELLASKRMVSLVMELKNRYEDRLIIFDAPPVLSTPQTTVLAQHVGQVVFVVEESKTPQYVVHEALEQLPDEKAIGLVLNKRETWGGQSGSYYGYYGSAD